MSDFQKFFPSVAYSLLGSIALLLPCGTGTATAQGPAPRLKAPIRVNLLQQSQNSKQAQTLAGRLKVQEQLRLPDQGGGMDASFLSKDLLPDYSQGDIVDDEDMLDQKQEDFLNPDFLKPVDGVDAFRNEQLEALRGELELEGEERVDEEEMTRFQKEQRETLREIAGQGDPFKFLETSGMLAEPKRGPPSAESKNVHGKDENVDRNNRASANLNVRDAEKGDEIYGGGGLGQSSMDKDKKDEGKSFANANTGSLIDGLINGNRDRLSILDSINKKYGTFNAGDRSAAAEERAPRMRRAFVENDDGGVNWRSDLRPPERNRGLDSLAPTRERDNRMGDRMIAGLSGGVSGRDPSGLRLPGNSLSTAGSDSSVATLRIGGSGKTSNSRSRSTLTGSPASRSNSRGFNMGSGFGSSFDNSPIKSPFKF